MSPLRRAVTWTEANGSDLLFNSIFIYSCLTLNLEGQIFLVSGKASYCTIAL